MAGVRDGKIDWLEIQSEADKKAVARIGQANQKYFDSRVLIHRSNLAYDNGNKAEGFALLVKASGLNPTHERILEVVKSLRRTYVEQMQTENFNEAIQVSRQLIELVPNSSGDINNLAWALISNPKSTASQPTDGIAFAKKASELAEKQGTELLHLQTMLTLTAAHRASGEHRESLLVATKGLDLARKAEAVEQVEDCQARFRRHVESLKKSIQQYPEN